MKKHTILFCAFLAAMGPFSSLGVGFRLPNQDPVGIARGNAFAATADNPSAIYYNPAGVTQLEGHNFQYGLYGIAVDSRYRASNGHTADTDSKIQGVPQIYYTFSPKENPFSFGLGVFAPYGLGLIWPEDSGFRTLSIEGKLVYASVAPVIAWEVSPRLSLSVGPTINVSQVKFQRGIMTATDRFGFRGDGVGLGYTAGLLWQPHAQWSLGLSYHSATDIDFQGHSKAAPYAEAEETTAGLPFPQFVLAGVSFRPNEKWNTEVNIDWTDWDALDVVNFRKPSGDAPFPFNFKSSFMYGAGVTRYLKDGYFASAGYFYSENSVPERNFNPAVPDTIQHSFSLGAGRKGERWSWAAAYQMLTGPWRTVQDSLSPSLLRESADGRYKFFNHALNVSVGYRF